MKFLMLIKHTESYNGQAVPQGLMDAMGEFVSTHMKSGVLKETAGLRPTAEGFRVALRRGQLGTTDGPFSETKEVIGGYALVEVPSTDAALEMAREFMDLHRIHWREFEGELEVRPLDG